MIIWDYYSILTPLMALVLLMPLWHHSGTFIVVVVVVFRCHYGRVVIIIIRALVVVVVVVVEIQTHMFLHYITTLLIHYFAILSCYIISSILVLQHATILLSLICSCIT